MPNSKLALTSYKRLVSDIAELYEGARKALIEAYWKIGRHIVQVEQKGEIKAAYGVGLLQKLSADLSKQCGPGFSLRQLGDMRRFYLANRIRRPAAELSWTQHIELLKIEDVKQRKVFELRTIHDGLKRDDLRTLVRHEIVREQVAENLAASPETREPPELLSVPKLGLLNTYQIKDSDDTAWPDKNVLLFDHGFKGYSALTPGEGRSLKAGDIVEWTGKKLLKTGRSAKDLYTYKSYLETVIDGDTLWVVLDIGMRDISRQKLRLRGIDCPEINTKEGQEAKKFVAFVLQNVPSLTVLSSQNASYDRYEADVFFTDKTGQEVYLNNLLLEKGYAVRVRE